MPITFRCSHCRQKLSITRRKAGQTVQCPKCQSSIVVPEPPSQQEASAEASEPAGAGTSAEASGAETSSGPPMAEAELPRFDEEPARQVGEAAPAQQGGEDDEGFTLRRASSEFEEMDLTPMVDVTFLLLIFFMITASFSLQKTIEVPAPEPDEQGTAQTIQSLDDLLDDSVLVEIDEESTIYVDEEKVADPNDLVDTLRDQMRSEAKAELVLTAHADALHETVIQVVDAANEVGMQRIRLATRGGG